MLPVSINITVNKDSPVPVRDQLMEQIALQIAAGLLKSNQRLPSIRALGKKLGIHHGIVNAAYNQLAEIGMLEIRQGSGVRVLAKLAVSEDEPSDLKNLFLQFMAKASEHGYSRQQICDCSQELLKHRPIKQIIVADRNPDFHPLIVSELQRQLPVPVTARTSTELHKNQSLLEGSLIITSLYHFLSLQGLPLDPTRFMILNVAPAKEVADAIKALPATSIVLFVSISPTLLRMAANVAAGLRGEAIAVRTALLDESEEISYMMRYAKMVVCDRPSQEKVRALAGKVPVHVFTLYPQSTIELIKVRLKEWG